MREMLESAAKFAQTGIEDGKHFLMACFALRKDGVFVKSKNAKVHRPHPNGHAEARVLRKAGFGAILWIARIRRDGNWAMAKPCRNCRILMSNRGVKKAYYTIGPNEYGVWIND